MKTQHYLGIFALAFTFAAPVSAQKMSSMDTLGKITGALDNSPREWITYAGKIHDETISSAHWQRIVIAMPDFSQVMEGMADLLSPEQSAQLEMLKNSGAAGNPMAALMGQPARATESIQVSISGNDPSSSTINMEHSLVLTAHINDVDAAIGKAIPVDLSYVAEASSPTRPQIVYVSLGEGEEASITFDRLDIKPEGGHATGSFQGSICRLDMKQMFKGPDPSDCINTEGTFDTALTEEEPFTP